MARRRRPPPVAAPERLCRFVAGEWPSSGLWDAYGEWAAARRVWGAEHPGSPLGNALDQLIFERKTRQRLARELYPLPESGNGRPA